jgi:hypothetical protein
MLSVVLSENFYLIVRLIVCYKKYIIVDHINPYAFGDHNGFRSGRNTPPTTLRA